MPPADAVWITRTPTTLTHLRGVVRGLEDAGFLDFGSVRIMAIEEGTAAAIPPRLMEQLPSEYTRTAGVFDINSLPPQGLLYIPTE